MSYTWWWVVLKELLNHSSWRCLVTSCCLENSTDSALASTTKLYPPLYFVLQTHRIKCHLSHPSLPRFVFSLPGGLLLHFPLTICNFLLQTCSVACTSTFQQSDLYSFKLLWYLSLSTLHPGYVICLTPSLNSPICWVAFLWRWDIWFEHLKCDYSNWGPEF